MAEVEFETAVDDQAGRIFEVNSCGACANLLVDVAKDGVHDARADVWPKHTVLGEMPLQDTRNRIELRPAEIGGADKVTADDTHASLRAEPRHFRFERKAIAKKEVQATAHTTTGVELRLEPSDTRRKTDGRAGAADSFDIEKDIHALLCSGGSGEKEESGHDRQRLHVVTDQQEPCGIR